MADPAAAAERKRAGWLKQLAALQCDPRALHVQSREPLRFAYTAVCYKLPRDFKHVGYMQLVLVDTARDEVRLVGFGTYLAGASNLLSFDAAGNWFWLTKNELMLLAPGETEPRRIASLELPWPFAEVSHLRGGVGCQLIRPLREPGVRDDSRSQSLALISYSTPGAIPRPAPEIQQPRFWHPLENAYVVRQQDHHVLIGCDGPPRPVSARDEARLAKVGQPALESFDIAANGDWLVHFDVDEATAMVFQGDQLRSFGPFVYFENIDRCGHPDCAQTLPFFAPHWSPSGEFFLVEDFWKLTVIRASDLRSVEDWKLRSHVSAFTSDREIMQLSKKHGAVFYRW